MARRAGNGDRARVRLDDQIDALRQSGAELLLRGADYDAAEAAGRDLARERNAVFISAYNDPAVVAGGGTIALEVLEELPATRTLIVPAGGGGLISGIGLAAHGVDPGVVVYGAQSEASPALHAAQQAGRLVPVEVRDSLADGLAGNVERDSITSTVPAHVASSPLHRARDRPGSAPLEHDRLVEARPRWARPRCVGDETLDSAGPTVIS